MRKHCLMCLRYTRSSLNFSVAPWVTMRMRFSVGMISPTASATAEESMPMRKSAPQSSTK